jgi:hypothetical protein
MLPGLIFTVENTRWGELSNELRDSYSERGRDITLPQMMKRANVWSFLY